MKNALDAIGESLSVFAGVVRRRWGVLVAVFLPIELFVFLLHYETVMRFDANFLLKEYGTENGVRRLLVLSVAFVAMVAVIRQAWALLSARSGEPCEMRRGFARAWGRGFGTAMLLMTILAALIVAFAGTFAVLKLFLPGFLVSTAFVVLLIPFAVGVTYFVTRWALAVPMSIVYGASGFSAMNASRKLVSGDVWKLFGFLVLAVLTARGLAAVPELVANCDVLGFCSPLVELSGAARFAAAAAMIAGHVVTDILGLLVPVTLLVFWRRAVGAAPTAPSVSRGGVLLLAAIGAFCTLGALTLTIFQTHFSGAKGSGRVFRLRNVEPIDEAQQERIASDLLLTMHLFDGSHAGIWVERPRLLEKPSKYRTYWIELPFCSVCGTSRADPPSCGNHGFDVFVKKAVLLDGHGGEQWPPYTFELLPYDETRPMTDAECEREAANLKRRAANLKRRAAERGKDGRESATCVDLPRLDE